LASRVDTGCYPVHPRCGSPLSMSDSPCLVVDLDRTLLLGDSLHEQIIQGFFSDPLLLFMCFFSLLRGRAAFKRAIATNFAIDAQTVPIREPLLTWLRKKRADGSELHLCTAAHQSIASSIADRLGLFTSVIGSVDTNLKGQSKADHLVRMFPGGFVYAGDSQADLAVWKQSQGIVLVGATASVERAARELGKPIEASFPAERFRIRDWLRAIRIHHWAKNALIFIPLLLGHDWNNLRGFVTTLMGFPILLLLVSSTYLINDLADLSSDRAHWSKCHRPIASGRISVFTAFCVGIGGIITALLLGFLVAVPFGIALFGYLAITVAYSFGLKQVPLLDIFIIAFLFTLRVVMGTVLAGQHYSEWLLAFSMVFFFSLAAAKRHTELLRTLAKGGVAARGYRAEDTIVTAIFGIATGVSSTLILALYFTEDSFQSATYHRPAALWIMPLLVSILIGRIWLLAQRGEMRDDPVSFVLRDRSMLGLGLVGVAAFLLAL
jgi:4-hydroxybenzoate polyprenyltransferase